MPGRSPQDAPTRIALAATAVALVLLTVAALLLLDSQADQRREIRQAYGQRAEIATGTVDSIFRVAFSGEAREAAAAYTATRPSTRLLDARTRATDDVFTAVVDASGEVLAASSGAPEDLARRMSRVPAHLRSALRAGYGISDVRVLDGRAVVESAVAFDSPFGRRLQVTAEPLQTFSEFLRGTLARLPRLRSGEAWVLDGRGRTIAQVPRAGRRPPSALTSGARTGTYDSPRGETFYRAEPLPRTNWRIAIAAVDDALLESVTGPARWLPWGLLALGAAALGAIALLLRRLLRTTGALSEANADLARSNRDLEQFAYVASHDLSEPLRTVAGFSQLLGRRYGGRLDAEADLYIEHMASGVDRMQQLIDDLLLYSRVDRQPIRAERVDLDELLGEVLSAIDPAVRERGARITSDDLPVVVGERSQLGQVLQNLLVNAVKFTAPDVTPEVHVSADRRGGRWHVSVRDNGIGIDVPPEQIFNMFARLHPADAYPGTGIGLALVKRILERHDGDIGVKPAPGGGSVFTFSLPDRAPVPAPSRVQAPA